MRVYAARDEIEILITSLLDEWLINYTTEWLVDPADRLYPLLVLQLKEAPSRTRYFVTSFERVVLRVTQEVLLAGVSVDFKNRRIVICYPYKES